MSYKFQTGPALMVGKLVQSGTLEIRDDDAGTLRFQIDTDSGAISGSGPSHQVGAVTFGGAVAATGSVTAGTSFIIGSADLNETDMEKLDGITNGTATAAKAVVLDASKNIATIGTIGCGAITSTGASSFGSISSVAAVTMTGVLSSSAAIQVVGNTILGGNLALSGTFTPTGVADATADLNADSLYFRDNDDSGLMKREEVKDFVDGIAGTVTNTGLAGESDGTMKIDIANMTAATIATTDTFVFNDQNGDVLRQETVDDLFTIGPALTTEAAITVADDYVLFLDGGATGDAKKEKWADIATAIAGANITATNGVLAASAGGGDTMTVSSSQDADLTLAAGLTWQASASAGDRTWTLPASPDNGDIITVKVGDLNGNKISIARAGSQTIDGANSVDIESNFGAVSLVYVGSDLWKIY